MLVKVPSVPGSNEAGKGLKAIDPARYGSLDHPGDAYSYDIYTQVARAVRAGAGLGGLQPAAAHRRGRVAVGVRAGHLLRRRAAAHPRVRRVLRAQPGRGRAAAGRRRARTPASPTRSAGRPRSSAPTSACRSSTSRPRPTSAASSTPTRPASPTATASGSGRSPAPPTPMRTSSARPRSTSIAACPSTTARCTSWPRRRCTRSPSGSRPARRRSPRPASRSRRGDAADPAQRRRHRARRHPHAAGRRTGRDAVGGARPEPVHHLPAARLDQAVLGRPARAALPVTRRVPQQATTPMPTRRSTPASPSRRTAPRCSPSPIRPFSPADRLSRPAAAPVKVDARSRRCSTCRSGRVSCTSRANGAKMKRRNVADGVRGWGPFTGRQLTTIICVGLVTILFPVGAWAVTGSDVFITARPPAAHAAVNSSGALSVTGLGERQPGPAREHVHELCRRLGDLWVQPRALPRSRRQGTRRDIGQRRRRLRHLRSGLRRRRRGDGRVAVRSDRVGRRVVRAGHQDERERANSFGCRDQARSCGRRVPAERVG